MDAQATNKDVIVVGGGLAGLTAACYLARGGVAVTVFEKAATLGGRAATQEYDGYRFNRGIHALYSGGALSEVLQELGISYNYGRPGESFVLHEGRWHLQPADLPTLLRTDLLNLGDKLEFLRLLAGLPRIKPQTLARVTVQEWLAGAVHRPPVRRLVAAIARTFVYSAALDLISAEVFVDKLQRAARHPVYYIDGGWQTLVEGLRRAAEQAGARIVTGARVEAVVHQAGQVQGIRLADGSLVPAAAVILAVTPQDAAHLVDGGAYAPLRRIVDGLIPAQVACLDVALRRLPPAAHAIVQDLDRPLFLSTQSLYSRVAPPGAALAYAFKQLDPTQPPDPHADEYDLERLLDAALPGWRETLVRRQSLPRILAVGTLPTAQGGGFAGRPGPQVPGLANLYLAGDWIGPTGFLADASLASARQVAQRLLQRSLAVAPMAA